MSRPPSTAFAAFHSPAASFSVRSMPVTRLALLPLVVLLSACAAGSTATPAPAPSGGAQPAAAAPEHDAVPASVRWFRASAERRVIFLQTYRLATAALERRAAGLPRERWAVVLDADETVLDNSPYQQEQARLGAPFDTGSWNRWVRRGEAAALAGAEAFTKRVRALGGRVVIVTNRDESTCAVTRENLRRVGIDADQVMCRTDPATSSKEARFAAVARGTAPSTFPALEVVMFVGDNIQDFPGLTQGVRTAPDSAFATFGDRFVLLPNPMYGSWERNPLP